jgi:hypothetical protein
MRLKYAAAGAFEVQRNIFNLAEKAAMLKSESVSFRDPYPKQGYG